MDGFERVLLVRTYKTVRISSDEMHYSYQQEVGVSSCLVLMQPY